MKFEVLCFRSREYFSERDEDQTIYVVRFKRLEGKSFTFNKYKQKLLQRCAPVLTGLPNEILYNNKLQRIENKSKGTESNAIPIDKWTQEEEEEDDDDDYDQVLAADNQQIQS